MMLRSYCRQAGSGNSLADVLLLALTVPEGSRKGDEDALAARDAQGKALATLAFLLEVKRFEPVQYLLGGGNATRVEPPLAQRLFLLAEHLEGTWQGTLLFFPFMDCRPTVVIEAGMPFLQRRVRSSNRQIRRASCMLSGRHIFKQE